MKDSALKIVEAAAVAAVRLAEPRWEPDDLPHSPSDSAEELFLPEGELWPELLGVEEVGAVKQILRKALLEPISELASRRGKRIRAQLVAFSCRLLSGDGPSSPVMERRCRVAAEAIEFIHAGSLIVDDIEDGSTTRRGRPALHVRYPMPLALNAGNWLYFWPFDLLKEVAGSEDQLLQIYEACHRTLLRAHFGQAIDLGAQIDSLDQERVGEICLASMRLKTGALMGLAALLGGAAAGGSRALLLILDDFGRDLGIALQMFDDLGNLIGKCEPAKRYEDMMLGRPSWVWACGAVYSTGEEYQKFLRAVRQLPDDVELEGWLKEHDLIGKAKRSARRYLDASFSRLEERLAASGAHWSRRALDDIRDLGERISVAYG
jgi:geranylgeranyl pyrophosphate synthase